MADAQDPVLQAALPDRPGARSRGRPVDAADPQGSSCRPARFTDLQRGLSGIAANLLAERLAKLVEDGLAEKGDGGHGTSVYALTGLGERTLGILFELAVFGSAFPAGDEIVRPGNLRTVATTLSAALARVRVPDRAFEARLLVDGEEMCLSSRDGRARGCL